MKYLSTEKETQKAVMKYLGLRHILHWRNQSGQMSIKDNMGNFKGVMNLGMAGSPDIFALHDGTLFGFEIKDIKGKQNDNQKDFERRMNEAGGEYYVIRDLNEVIEIFGKKVEEKKERAIPEIPSCGHKRKSHFYNPLKKTLCLPCIEKLEI
ncbi:MAG: hypothetical protein WC269_03005 [Candidatus Gracilibacteria bacterium]|jgi:hypothetical protein